MQETANTLKKKFGKNWIEIDATLDELCQNFDVYANQAATIRKALELAQTYRFSFFDCIILSSALAAGCTIVYSEDMQNGVVIEEKLKIINPFLM